MVINMDDTVAVTQNFADEANLLQVRRSMLSDPSELTQVLREHGMMRAFLLHDDIIDF